MVNGKAMIDYFDRDCHKDDVLLPLQVTQKLGLLNVRCTVEGGGNTGQAGAVRLGIARALEAHDPYLRPPLKNGGCTSCLSFSFPNQAISLSVMLLYCLEIYSGAPYPRCSGSGA
ncbi:unnamed protein product [Choristocarpus tenellus]